MRRLAAAHLPLAAVWFTSGGLHSEEREAESRRAMDLLGVKPRDRYFFRLPDRHLLDFMDEVVERLSALLIRLKPASVFVPAFEGGHPDHDAVQLAASLALRRIEGGGGGARSPAGGKPQRSRLYEFPLYNRAAARLLDVGRFIPGTTAVEQTPMKLKDRLMKQKLLRIFRSQRAILWPLTGLRGGPMMVHVSGEPYRRVPRDRDYTVRPHPGRLAYEYYTRVRFEDLREARAPRPPAA